MDLYLSACRWIESFKRWTAWGAPDLDTSISQEVLPHTNLCKIVLETQNQESCNDRSTMDGIVVRFFLDPISILFGSLQMYDQKKWKSIFMTVYSGVVRPFKISKRFEYTLPIELPRSVIMTTHHRSWNIRDGDCQAMNFIAHIQTSFDVIMKQEFNYFGIGAYFTERFFSGKPMLRNPHQSILKTWIEGIENTEDYASSKQQRCMAIVPDRDSQQIENDTQVGFGLGAYALALAVKMPILDVIAFSPLLDNTQFALDHPSKERCLLSRVEVRTHILNHALDDPRFAHVTRQDLSNLSQETYNAWRKKYDAEIKEFACIAKTKFLEVATLESPMCPIVAQKSYPEQIERSRLLTKRYGCPLEGPTAVVPPNYTEIQKNFGYIM